jgi:Tol biopolymer transport system component
LQLSPDGKLLGYIKPDAKSGTANIFVRSLPAQGARPARTEGFESEISIFDRDGTDNDVQITFDTDQGVSAYSWTEDGGSVVFIQDKDGDENFHLYLSSVRNPAAAIDLTPFAGVKAEGIVSSERFPDRMFIVSGSLGWSGGSFMEPVLFLLVAG